RSAPHPTSGPHARRSGRRGHGTPAGARVRRPRAAGGAPDAAGLGVMTVVDGILVLRPGDDNYPAALADDPEPPESLYVRGSLAALDRPRVGIVGTRRCTQTGSGVARQLGRELAANGVAIVSGLAVGIDGCAHEGAVAAHAAPSAGMVARGLDVVYPK